MSKAETRAATASLHETQHPNGTLHPDGLLRVLENEHLRVQIAPARGGKIVSLFSKRTATEWLLPPLRAYDEATATGGFEQWDGGGFDECLPTIAATATAPDHGELWRCPWQEEPEPDAILLRTTAYAGAIAVRRRARLDGPCLVLDYAVENVGNVAQSLLYSAHPLLRVVQGDRIQLPGEVLRLRVEGSRAERLGQPGDRIGWPVTRLADGHATEDVSTVGPPDGQQADKLFAGPLAVGWCTLFRPSLGEGLMISFPPETLPYVGLWICRAAWPEEGTARQYTVALEPTNANCDSLADAERDGTAWRLDPGQRREWTLCFGLIGQPVNNRRNGTNGTGANERGL